jgi:hypothetical protein
VTYDRTWFSWASGPRLGQEGWGGGNRDRIHTELAVGGRAEEVGRGKERSLGQGQRWLSRESSERAAGRRSIPPA